MAVMTERAFAQGSALTGEGLALDLAPALTPRGIEAEPSFFHGFATEPLVLARGLLTLADITTTRYVRPLPTRLHDPVLTANGDRLRVECFSACNGALARLDLLQHGFDGGQIGHGTTNVDIGNQMRTALTRVPRHALLHLDVGRDRLAVATPDEQATERRVDMPDRWVRAFGNAAELQEHLEPVFTVGAEAARRLVSQVPRAIPSPAERVWWSASASGVRVSRGRTAGGVQVAGPHRIQAVARLLVHLQGLTVHALPGTDAELGPVAVEFHLPAARMTLTLSPEPHRGFSGEGSLLAALSGPGVADDADLVSTVLAFEPVIEVQHLVRETALPESRVRSAIAVLASSGRVGWDAHDRAHFHRELPDDPARIEKDNPRLVAARALVDEGAVSRDQEGSVVVSDGTRYRVQGDRCTCRWWVRNAGSRGPCKHVLAVSIAQERN